MSHVTQIAYPFVQSALLENGEIDHAFSWAGYTQGHDAVLFFYPLDFTFVCPSELIALNHRIEHFKKRHTKVIAVSVDSVYSHAAFCRLPMSEGGAGPLAFPLVSDLDRSICRHYGVEHPTQAVALRATVIVDAQGMVRAHWVQDLPLGRNVDEILRMIDAIQFHRAHGEVCPAGWSLGSAGMVPNAEGVQRYLTSHGETL